jgi:hypothetical protein
MLAFALCKWRSSLSGLSRVRVFLGCEGESERSYGTLLHRLVDEQARLHIDSVLLNPGCGDPLSLVERACEFLVRAEKVYGAYTARAVLLDSDIIGQSPDRDRRIVPLAERANLILIWQKPCHESFLLHHVNGCEALKPPGANELRDNILSYLDMCQREGASLQRGMNFRLGGHHSVILMSLRPNAPYRDRLEEGGSVLLYEGHDLPRSPRYPNPKLVDQPMRLPLGQLSENGKFYEAAKQAAEAQSLPI